MAQFSMEIMRLTGSVLVGNQQAQAITARELALVDFTNILVNDWTTGSLAGWSVDGTASVSSYTPEVNAAWGSWRLYYSGRAISSGYFACTETETFYLSAWVYNAASTTQTYLGAILGDAQGANPIFPIIQTLAAGVGWTFMSGQVTVPAGKNKIAFIVYSERNGVNNPQIVVSKPTMRRAANASLVVDGAISTLKLGANAVTTAKLSANAVTANELAANAVTAVKIAAAAITGDKIAANTIAAASLIAGSITARELILTDYSNMADYGWQAGSLAGWTVEGAINFTKAGGSGSYGVDWVLNMAGRNAYPNDFIQCSYGESYFFDVWVYNQAAERAILYAEFATGDTATFAFLPVGYTDAKNSWQRLQGRMAVPPGYNQVRIFLVCDRFTNGAVCAWSSPIMRRAANAELLVDGSVTANKLQVNSLDAITANFGNSTHTGYSQSANGKIQIDWNVGSMSFFD